MKSKNICILNGISIDFNLFNVYLCDHKNDNNFLDFPFECSHNEVKYTVTHYIELYLLLSIIQLVFKRKTIINEEFVITKYNHHNKCKTDLTNNEEFKQVQKFVSQFSLLIEKESNSDKIVIFNTNNIFKLDESTDYVQYLIQLNKYLNNKDKIIDQKFISKQIDAQTFHKQIKDIQDQKTILNYLFRNFQKINKKEIIKEKQTEYRKKQQEKNKENLAQQRKNNLKKYQDKLDEYRKIYQEANKEKYTEYRKKQTIIKEKISENAKKKEIRAELLKEYYSINNYDIPEKIKNLWERKEKKCEWMKNYNKKYQEQRKKQDSDKIKINK